MFQNITILWCGENNSKFAKEFQLVENVTYGCKVSKFVPSITSQRKQTKHKEIGCTFILEISVRVNFHGFPQLYINTE